MDVLCMDVLMDGWMDGFCVCMDVYFYIYVVVYFPSGTSVRACIHLSLRQDKDQEKNSDEPIDFEVYRIYIRMCVQYACTQVKK